MVKQRFIVILLAVVLFLAGCTNVDIRHTINPDGSSSIEALLDYEPFVMLLYAAAEESGEEVENGELSDVCDSYDFDHYGLENVECALIGDHQVIVRGDYPAGTLELEEVEGVLSYSVKSVYPLIGFAILPTSYSGQISLDDEESTQTQSENPVFDDEYLEDIIELSEELVEHGGDIYPNPLYHSYEVTMPGEVVRTDVGVIQGNSVLIDMFELPLLDEPVIVASLYTQTGEGAAAQEDFTGVPEDSPQASTSDPDSIQESGEIRLTTTALIFGLLGLVGVVGISFLIIALSKKKESPPEKNQSDPDNYLYKKSQAQVDNYTVNKIVEWIHKYEKKFPDSMLKDVLRKHGHSEENIEEAFRRR